MRSGSRPAAWASSSTNDWTAKALNEASTERQRAYARRFNGGQVYTPQIVVEGAGDMVGSNRAAVLAA